MDKELIKRLKEQGRKRLTEPEAKGLLKGCAINVPKSVMVNDLKEAVEKAETLSYPLVLKIVSREIPHKTEVGGVIAGIRDKADIEKAWLEMLMSVADKLGGRGLEGFMLEEMVPEGVEIIVGSTRDPQFGPVVMFGMGGVIVELMRDVSFRLAPVAKDEALDMMREIKGYPLLTGFRGRHYDTDAIGDVIVKVSAIMDELEEVREFEINPLIAYRKGCVAVDARCVLT